MVPLRGRIIVSSNMMITTPRRIVVWTRSSSTGTTTRAWQTLIEQFTRLNGWLTHLWAYTGLTATLPPTSLSLGELLSGLEHRLLLGFLLGQPCHLLEIRAVQDQ